MSPCRCAVRVSRVMLAALLLAGCGAPAATSTPLPPTAAPSPVLPSATRTATPTTTATPPAPTATLHSTQGAPRGGIVTVATHTPPPVTELVVTNASDVVDGNVSNPQTLLSNPGSDGISLREAITAANNAFEPQEITFADELAGETIVLKKALMLTRDGTTLTGLVDSAGQPAVTLDGHEAGQIMGLLYILASDITVRQLHIVGQVNDGISVLVGRNPNAHYSDQPHPRQEVRNIQIKGSVFTDTGSPPARGAAIRIYMEPEGGSADALIEDVRVIGNTVYSPGCGVDVAANGTNCQIRDVVIADNRLEGAGLAVETAQGANNRVLGTRILHNTFIATSERATVFIAHLVDPPAPRGTFNTGGLIDGTVVEGNSFSAAYSISILGGQDGASDCVISNTDFVNNTMCTGDVTILGGKRGATGNQITGLRFVNNTLMAEFNTSPNAEGGTGNTVSGPTLRNAILGLGGFKTQVDSEVVSYYCLIESGGFPGDGNKTGDPRFLNRAAGDFHLLADSPAIDAGTADGAPATDIECRPRAGPPDIGAYEFGAPAVARLILSIARGRGTVGHSPAGFECGSAASFLAGSRVQLTAEPAAGFQFAGWSGDADCLDGTVTMAAARHCVATFTH